MNKIRVVKGDITKLDVDAIVNAANSSLLGGGGVDGAIHRAAGRDLLAECRLLGGCKTGEAKITKGYNLPAKYVIHTVGPVWNGGLHGEEKLLESCYKNSLALADKNNILTIAFPAISTGIYGYPIEKACLTAYAATKEYLRDNNSGIEEIYFVCFDDTTFQKYNELANGDDRNANDRERKSYSPEIYELDS